MHLYNANFFNKNYNEKCTASSMFERIDVWTHCMYNFIDRKTLCSVLTDEERCPVGKK